ncbi:unnamed protein product [Chironomus riparius]|uniref:Nuclear receptor-binding factor 2 MIT domain-containing protein n=1 Tax=Chironomus riparius TaxID=315576 RepID=A0A9N9WSX3_9DIPT|nr:unnamed protein product [Chironomus riparius]
MDTPINKAHFYARKSLHYMGNEKFKYIEQAIENFQLALTQSSNTKAIDSIELQIRYYEKQLKLLSARKAFCQKSEKHKNTDEDVSFLTVNEHVDKSTEIQLDLLKNLEDSYNVIEELNRIDNVQVSSQVSQLQNLNSQLNVMFHKLSIAVEMILNENELLREKVRDNPKSGTTCNTGKPDEFRRNINEIIEQRDSDDSSPNEEIQELPPLELPSFNLDSLDDK